MCDNWCINIKYLYICVKLSVRQASVVSTMNETSLRFHTYLHHSMIADVTSRNYSLGQLHHNLNTTYEGPFRSSVTKLWVILVLTNKGYEVQLTRPQILDPRIWKKSLLLLVKRKQYSSFWNDILPFQWLVGFLSVFWHWIVDIS